MLDYKMKWLVKPLIRAFQLYLQLNLSINKYKKYVFNSYNGYSNNSYLVTIVTKDTVVSN